MTDAHGRVTSITDSVCGNHNYKYDERGYLTKADGQVITYDENGNITKCGTKVYTYDQTIKDKLVSFNGKTISYNDSNPLNPTEYDGKIFSWFGRRLKSIRGNVYINFAYNEQGLRVGKTGAESVDYYYDGDLLITEKRSNFRLDYLYDENKQLYGFIYNSSTKYFYVRDILQNINGIIDINGNLVVKYDYTAYGSCSILSDVSANNIGTINPFRYKGYYYDVETGLFWCNSRYYNPEWGRWISPDSIEYLNPQSLNGLNLYAYCNNDPVNFKQRPVSSDGSITTSSISISSSARSRRSPCAIKQIAKTLSTPKSSGFNLFGYELRTSAGWDTSPDIATSFFGRIGFSSYVTYTQGQSGMLYAFAGSTSDIMNWMRTTYYAGVGINLFDILGVEAYLETIGIGAQVNIGRFSVGADINLISGTSITLGWNTDLGNGMTKTDGFTVGVNTGCLVAVICWIYKFVTTGDPSPVPGLQPAY